MCRSEEIEIFEKKRKQAIGAKVLEVYTLVLFCCFCLHDKLPTFQFEYWSAYDFFDLANWMGANMWLPISLAIVYLLSIFGIQAYLKERKTIFKLKNSMAAWNLLLAIFSFVGSVRCVPMLFRVLNKVGVHGLMCENTMNEFVVGNPAGPWCAVFLLSKIPELLDTYFIVLQKKKLITLHWVHHSSVMLVSWHGLATLSFNGLIFVCMNFAVHACMYFFYFLGLMGYRPTKYAKVLTRLQISQMFVGICSTLYLLYHLAVESPLPYVNEIGVPSTVKLLNRETDEWFVQDHGYCKANYSNVLFSMAIYITYFSLFTHFYIQAYVTKGTKRRLRSKPMTKTGQKISEINREDKIKREDNAYLLIDGVVYDVSEFSRRHPGGAVIRHYYGANASQVFEAFHYRSKKARMMLRSLPVLCEDGKDVVISEVKKYPGEKGDSEAMLKDFEQWRQSLVERGFFEPSIGHVIYRNLELVALYFVSLYFFASESYIPAISFLGLCGGRAGWLMHEGGHGSLTGNLKFDKAMQCFWYGFMDGLSGSTWNSMHNRHHASTQKLDHDTDLETMPLVAFHDKAVEHNKAVPGYLVSTTWIRFQHLLFFLVTSPLVLAFWSLGLHPMRVIAKSKMSEAFWMLMGHIFHTLVIKDLTGLSTTGAYGVFWLSRWWAAVYIFGHFSLSHTHLPTVEADENATWVDQALGHTADICTQNPAVNWIMGYLNCQVVHHLFPQMPQFRHPEVSRELEVFAAKWGRTYIRIGYFDAWKRTYLNLKTVGDHISQKEKSI